MNQSSETRVLKTFEYLAPEYEDSGIDSSKTDVYSLGVVLLELITGRKTIEETRGKSFLRWVTSNTSPSFSCMQLSIIINNMSPLTNYIILLPFDIKARPLLKDKTYGELIDPVVLESHDLHQLFWMVRLTEKCINPDPSKRFSIHKVHCCPIRTHTYPRTQQF